MRRSHHSFNPKCVFATVDESQRLSIATAVKLIASTAMCDVTALPAPSFLSVSMLVRLSLCQRKACIPQDALLIPCGLIPHGAHAPYETMHPMWNSRTRSTYQAPHMEPDMGSQTRC